MLNMGAPNPNRNETLTSQSQRQTKNAYLACQIHHLRSARNIAGAARGGTNGGDKPMIRTGGIDGPDMRDSNAISNSKQLFTGIGRILPFPPVASDVSWMSRVNWSTRRGEQDGGRANSTAATPILLKSVVYG